MRRTVLTLALWFPVAAFAVGDDTATPPTPTETTKTCETGLIWDAERKECAAPKDTRFDDADRYNAARELAYVGDYKGALRVLDAMAPADPRRLTYLGFVHRKQGNVARSMAYYTQALELDPDNFLARSYLGQGYIALGKTAQAEAELREIRARGGRDTWAAFALKSALRNGVGYAY